MEQGLLALIFAPEQNIIVTHVSRENTYKHLFLLKMSKKKSTQNPPEERVSLVEVLEEDRVADEGGQEL